MPLGAVLDCDDMSARGLDYWLNGELTTNLYSTPQELKRSLLRGSWLVQDRISSGAADITDMIRGDRV